MLREYWENKFVSNENVVAIGEEVVFAVKDESTPDKETALWKLNPQSEEFVQIQSGLKRVSHILNNPYASTIIVQAGEQQGTGHRVAAFDYAGEPRWSRSFDENVIGVLVGENGETLISTIQNRKGKLYCLDANGKLAWERTFDGFISRVQVVGNNKIYFGLNNKVFALQMNGEKLEEIADFVDKVVWQIALWKDDVLLTVKEKIICCKEDGSVRWTTELENAAVQSKLLFDENGNMYFLTTKSELVSLNVEGTLNWKKQIKYHAIGARFGKANDKIMVLSEKDGTRTAVEIFNLDGTISQTIEKEESIVWMKALQDKYVYFSYDTQYMKGTYINVFPQAEMALENEKVTYPRAKRDTADDPTQWKLDWAGEVSEYIALAIDLYAKEYGKFEAIKIVFTMDESPKISLKSNDAWIAIDFEEMQYRSEDEDRDSYKECYYRNDTIWYEFVQSECPGSLDYIASESCKRLERVFGIPVSFEVE